MEVSMKVDEEREQKELAEFGAKFLSMRLETGFWKLPNEKVGYPDIHLVKMFFEWSKQSPCLAHLAKREMESKVAHFCTSWTYDADGYTVEWIDFEGNGDCRTHENEYIALWLAIREAVDKACKHDYQVFPANKVMTTPATVCTRCGKIREAVKDGEN